MTTDWAIPQQAKLKYTQLFNLHDRSRSGFLSGLQCRDILLQSGLPRNVLAEIWNFSDIDGDGQLTREEFILAMHLTNHVRTGQPLPNELPPDLVPPSYRRTRSISTTSVHSATSAGSSASAGGNVNDEQALQGKSSSENVTGLTSFEDKRRENFEKGRAELERRRMKMIEQQMSILSEQLVASKKQVTEAKAKIDAMRSDRDTKMGLLTALEAQLKTVQDRKAYLNHEELNLIAIAKDLNLVNPAQAELDQLATQAKQQSINQMKEKLVEFAKEKEIKIAETDEINKRLEESKKELKAVSEKVNKAYEDYKEKVANAKIVRVQIINENKSQLADLDSAWDAAPSFAPSQSNNRVEASAAGAEEDPWNFSKTSNDQQNAFISNSENNESPFNSSSLDSRLPQTNEGNGFQENIPDPSRLVKKYRALYAFEARNPDELTINPGDIISGSEEVCEPGWLSGELNGKSGLFPEAYVEPHSEDVFAARANDMVKKDTNFTLNEDTFHQITTEPCESTQSDTSSTANTAVVKYKVVYAFDARNPDELTINPGDIIVGVEGAHEPGWLMGQLNGQKGLFPEAYVEKFAEKVQPQPEVEVSYQHMSCLNLLILTNYSYSLKKTYMPKTVSLFNYSSYHSLSLSLSLTLADYPSEDELSQ